MANPFTPEQISQILEEFFKVVGTRQYIGARYVPIFGRKGEESIEWDNSAPYEPLTIVLYQGNSYTSRQFVPVGVEITNQEFWAITGNYNAQVELYRQEVRNLLPYDETPTEGSTKAVTSDGIKKAIADETTRATEAEKTNATAIEQYRREVTSALNATPIKINSFNELKTIENPSSRIIKGSNLENAEIVSGIQNAYFKFDHNTPFTWNNTDEWHTHYYENEKWNYSAKAAITFKDCKNVVFDGLVFKSDITDPHILTWSGIRLEHCENVTFVNCTIEGFKWNGIDISAINNQTIANKNISIENCLVRRCRFNIYDFGYQTKITNCVITDDYSTTQECIDNGGIWKPASPTYDSMYYDGIMAYGERSIISNNVIYENGQSGIYSARGKGLLIANNQCFKNYNVGIDMGVVSIQDDIYPLANVSIIGNICKENKHMGINTTNVSGFYVSDNVSENNGSACIVVEGSSFECVYTNNVCNSDTYRGISFGLQTANNIVVNTFGNAKPLVSITSAAGNNKNYEYNLGTFDKLNINVPFEDGQTIKNRTPLISNVDDSLNAQYWVANKPIRLSASESGNDYQALYVGALKTYGDMTASNIYVKDDSWLRVGQSQQSDIPGAIWYDPKTQTLKFGCGTGVSKTIATI